MQQRDIADCRFKVLLKCADCGKQLNSTKALTSAEIQREWTMIVMSSGFNAGRCPSGCKPTFSDLNAFIENKEVAGLVNHAIPATSTTLIAHFGLRT